MRNLFATVPYFRTTIYFSFMLTDISLWACYLFACVRFFFTHPEEDRQVGRNIGGLYNVSYLHLCLIYICIYIYIYPN